MPKYKNLTPEEFKQQMESDPNAVVLDVRTVSEYNNGHLENAINVPVIQDVIENLDKDKNYYLHCRVGGRSAIVAQVMINRGFEHVNNLNAPIEELGLPLVKTDNG